MQVEASVVPFARRLWVVHCCTYTVRCVVTIHELSVGLREGLQLLKLILPF